jgi:hypothetical protein
MTLTVSDFRIFANSANKHRTTVTMNQILRQKWFYFRTSTIHRTFAMVFSITENVQRCCLFDRVSAKFSKFKLDIGGICNQKYFYAFLNI